MGYEVLMNRNLQLGASKPEEQILLITNVLLG